ncbi:hypothetical protein A8E95_01460 [Burkholderia cenocepacia]|nr:hypothetical protein A8E96_21675 [Burkholderia cenocepacia]ONW38758.1 hypothetical protein A8E95_01460 [Burkholderia cenocepacia]
MPGASVFGTADGSPLTRPNELTQATCHVGVDRAASPAAQGAAGSGHVTATRGALSVAMHRGTDVVRCSTVVVRHRGARGRGTMHTDAAWRLLARGGHMRVRGHRTVCGIAPRAPRRAGWPGYC